MSRKAILTIVFLFILVLSVIFAASFTVSASANFYVPPPELLSPTNSTYQMSSVPLDVRIRQPVFFLQYTTITEVSFSLDGSANASLAFESQTGNDEFVTYWSNTTLSWLSDGNHTIEVCAKSSPTNYSILVGSATFTVNTDDGFVPLPLVGIAAVSVSIFATVGVLLYFVRSRKRTRELSTKLEFYSNQP